jgi:hypothetical protein
MVGFCGHGGELSGSIKVENLLITWMCRHTTPSHHFTTVLTVNTVTRLRVGIQCARFQAGARHFSLSYRCVQTGSGAHPASYPMGNEGKAAGREADHWPPSSAMVKKMWSYTSTPPYVLMAWFVISTRDNFTFLLHLVILHRYCINFAVKIAYVNKEVNWMRLKTKFQLVLQAKC